MDKGLKVAILCSDEELGKEAYKSIGSMPTDNYVDTFVVDENHSFSAKSIEDHFRDMENKLREFIGSSDNDYFCYIADQVVEVLNEKYLITIACGALKQEKIKVGTSGLLMIESLEFIKLQDNSSISKYLHETALEKRVLEAVNNVRS